MTATALLEQPRGYSRTCERCRPDGGEQQHASWVYDALRFRRLDVVRL